MRKKAGEYWIGSLSLDTSFPSVEWDNNPSLEGTSGKEQRVWVQMHILMACE